jgi:hypothetical protein
VYQQFAEKAEEAVPRTWWREAFSHDALFLSGRDTQPLVQLKERPMRYKKLRNLYQCATRQVFIRQAFNVSGGATGLYRHAQHVMDSGTGTKGANKNRGAGRCPAFQNTAVSAFAAKFMEGSTRELLGGTIDAVHGRWRGRSSGPGSAAADGIPGDVDGDGEIDIMEASQMDLHRLSAEVLHHTPCTMHHAPCTILFFLCVPLITLTLSMQVLNHFLASPTAGIWQGCFRIQKSPDCRAVLAAACLVEAAHLLPALAAPEAATAFKDPGELVSGYMMASLGRHLLHGATEGTAVAQGGLILGLQLADFVVLQQAYLKLYSDSFGALYTSQLATRVPLSFPVMGPEEPFSKAYFPSEALARDKPWPAMYLEGKVTMEPVFSTVRNWMFAEAQNLIDFGPYRPLVANPSVRAALHGSRKRSRRVLIDVGANGFFASPKYLLDSYEPFAAFTDAFMVEPEEHFKAEIPQSYKDRYNITHLQMYAEVNTGTPSDMLALLPSLVTKDDFVVLKFDVDPNRFAQVNAPCLMTHSPCHHPRVHR